MKIENTGNATGVGWEGSKYDDEKVAFLSSPAAYAGHYPVEVRETHLSWVFLTDEWVFKFKKPVVHAFIDLTTLERRHELVLEELHINREFARDVYVDVLPLTRKKGIMKIAGGGTVVEWLLKMRRLDEADFLSSQIRSCDIDVPAVDAFADWLMSYYLRQVAVQKTEKEHTHELMEEILGNSEKFFAEGLDVNHSQILIITTNLVNFLAHQKEIFRQRVDASRIRECHGDLRPEHVCLTDPPCAIDRLEFDRSLRIMDPLEELAFLDLECAFLGSDIGQRFFETYQRRTGDWFPLSLPEFYKAKRALLRAWLSISHILSKRYSHEDSKWRSRCQAYLDLAERSSRNLTR